MNESRLRAEQNIYSSNNKANTSAIIQPLVDIYCLKVSTNIKDNRIKARIAAALHARLIIVPVLHRNFQLTVETVALKTADAISNQWL